VKWTLAIGLVLAVVPWVVFDIIDRLNPHSILFGLGMIVIALSFVGCILVIIGLVSLFRSFAARRQAPK
jgi:uncharacterized membrane protein YphA (DoxX/SURF4 family)